MQIRRLPLLVTACSICLLILAGAGAIAADKKPITHDVYDGWQSIQGTKISRDGTWLAYALAPQDGDGEVVIRNLKTGREYRHPRGKEPQISADGAYAVFVIAPPKADVDKAKKEKKKPEDQPKAGMGIMKLASGEVFTVDRVKSFKLAEDGPRFAAYLMEAEKKKSDPKSAEEKKEETAKAESEKSEGEGKKKKEKKKDPGTELIIRDLSAGTQTSVAEVTEYAWSKNGSWLAYAVSSKTPANDGACAWSAADGATRRLMTGLGNYKSLTFDEKGTQLAFLSDRDDYQAEASPFRLYHWQSPSESALELVSGATPGLPAGYAASENGRLEFSKDGERLFFGTSAAPKAEPEDASEAVKVDIWSWKDPELQPMQKARAEEEKKRSYRAMMHLKEKRFVQLATPEMPSVTLIDHPKYVLGTSNVPYRQLVSWDTGYEDAYVIDLSDGSRRKILEKAEFPGNLSPGGTYALYFDREERDWVSHRIRDGKRVNLTDKLKVSWQDETWDTPNTPRPYGIAGWTAEDRTVLVYDRYDIWELQPDASNARMVTNGVGRNKRLVFRYQRLDPEEKTLPTDKPLMLSTTDDQTKATGYYRVTLNRPGDPNRIVMQDKQFGSLLKAKDAETLVFTLQRFEEFPNLWTSDGNFSGMQKVSDANPQQAEYNWGRSELIDFRNTDGKPLRAVLTRPENFDPSKKYPLMVYIYEELTNGLHRYIAPSPGTSVNITRYVSNGYVVLQPDIIYDTGYPGQSAMKCVLPAVQKALDMGFIDPERIGIQGHSWGGYQITYMITQTDIFRAVEAGASVSNMVSAYGGIRWGTGMSRAFQYERTQSRIGAPPWERSLQFIENSPIFWVEKVKTPYLTIHNDEDDAVPWYQGIEFFSALRRLGKEAYMFNFNGEKHGLRERENQKYWTIYMTEFFDHYLKSAPRPDWMDKGVPYLERGKRDMTPFYPKKGVGSLQPPKEIKPALESITAANLLKHVQVMAADEFEGRSPGTKGEELTVRYLQEQFKKLNLKPGNPNGSYLQTVPMAGFTASPEAFFTIGTQRMELKFPTDYVAVSRRYNPETKVDNSDMVFVGYGVEAPEYQWDDFKGYDVRGKTVVMLVNDPPVPDPKDPSRLDDSIFKGRAMTYYGRWTYKYEIASLKGAAAVLLVHETGPAGYPWEVVVGSWGRENFDIQSAGGKTGRVAVESWISSDCAKKLFSLAGQDYDALIKAAAKRDFKPVPLNARAHLRVRNALRRIQSNNVVARLEGSDPILKNEYVVYTAHWDHLGKDEKLQGDQVFNGARDNATGTAALLELAGAFTRLEKAPKRTLLFLAVTAEEQGLLGAKFYAENPLYPLAKTAANINMDGMNVWGPTRDMVVVGLGNTTLDDLLKEEAGKAGRYLKPDPEPEKGSFYRSDHFEFAKLGVPVLNPGAGSEVIGKPAGFGERKREEYTARDYHKVTDEIKPDWDLSGATGDAQLLFIVGYRVAQESGMPEWKPGTEFKAKRDAALKAGASGRVP